MLPPPTQRQARIIWASLTALAVAVSIGLIGVLLWGFGWVINRLASVLLPLAVAGVVACVLDPLVDYFQRRKMTRVRAILLVFALGVVLLLFLLATVLPQLINETGDLINQLPAYGTKLRNQLSDWLQHSPRGLKLRDLWETHAVTVQEAATKWFPVASSWVLTQLTRVVSWFSFLVGLLLVPVYVFYFLLEKEGIEKGWARYLPLRESAWKEELVFIVQSMNENLVVFFRGQVLVGMCVGILTAIGFAVIGLKYGLLLGFMTGVFGIVPYLGVMISIVPAVALAIIQFGDWRVLLVLLVFGLVQLAEGFVISPKIIGDRVGLHPLTIMIAVMVGTALMGGLVGGLLAIPLTAALRTLMFRYVWPKPKA